MGCVLEFIKIKCSDNTSHPKYCIQKLFAKMIRLHLTSLHFSFLSFCSKLLPFLKRQCHLCSPHIFLLLNSFTCWASTSSRYFPQVEKGIKWQQQQQQQQRISLSKNFTPYERFYLCKCACVRKACVASPPLFASFCTHAVFARIRAQELNNFERLQLSLPRFAWTKYTKTFF